MTEEISAENTTKKQRVIGKPFKPGQSGNPNGRPPGSLNFSTKWNKFIEKVAEQNNTTVDKIDEGMLKIAYDQIMSGDYKYWKDTADRVYGQATQNINVDGKLEIDDATREKTTKAIQDIIRGDTG